MSNLTNLIFNCSDDIINPLKKVFRKKGYVFFNGPFNVNLIGIRAKERDIRKMSDRFLLVYEDHLCNWHAEILVGTTVPGEFYHYNYTNPDGLGIIVPGQYRGAFRKGKHKGRDALIQNTTFKVYRDSNKDGVIDKNVIKDAPPSCRFNFHHAKSSIHPHKIFIKNIGRFSEGCQVPANWVKYKMCFDIISYSMKLYNSKSITYTLLDEDDLKMGE